MMEFSVKKANEIIGEEVEEIMTRAKNLANCPIEYDISGEMLMKNNKKPLADCLSEMTIILAMCREQLIGAISQLDESKSNQISLQKQLIEKQEEVIKCKTEQLNKVQTVVRDELKSELQPVKSYCEAVGKGISSCAAPITPDQVKDAVKCAVKEEDRTRNVVVFGVSEAEAEELHAKVLDIFESLDEKPQMSECVRLGRKREGAVRPIMVKLGSSETVQRVLFKARCLKGSEQYNGVYFSVDRTVEERATRKQLVEQLKIKREAEPELFHFIKNDQIFSRSRANATQRNVT